MKKRKPSQISSMVGHHIEISNRFIHDYVAVFQIAKQCKTRSRHKPPLSKGGLEGLYIWLRTSVLPPLQKKGETVKFLLLSSGGRTRTSDLRVMSPTSCQLLYPAMYR